MTRLDKNQTCLLVILGTPTRSMIVTDECAKSLVRLDLLRVSDTGGSARITPAGLRALADEMEAGRVDDALEAIRKDAAERAAMAVNGDKSLPGERDAD